MMILAQNGECLINTDNIVALTVNGVYIHAHPTDGSPIAIGAYESEERARNVFANLVQQVQHYDMPQN